MGKGPASDYPDGGVCAHVTGVPFGLGVVKAGLGPPLAELETRLAWPTNSAADVRSLLARQKRARIARGGSKVTTEKGEYATRKFPRPCTASSAP